MTIEDIERTLQTVTEQSAGLTVRQQRLEETVQDVVALHQQVLRNHEARQAKLEEAFRQVAESHQAIVQLAGIHEDRLDSQDEGQVHTDARLDALIDSQIQLTQRVDTLTGDIAALNGHFEQTDERLNRMSERAEAHDRQLGQIDERLSQVAALQSGNAGQIKVLIEAQARTDEQIRLLLDRNGVAPPTGRGD
ncbi:MAG: hypothetical protein ACREEM_24790 [Blastocatellia bacterium]